MAGEEDGPESAHHGHLYNPVSRQSRREFIYDTDRNSSFVGTIVLMTVINTDTATKAGLLVSYYIVLSFWAAQNLSMSMLSRNIGGQTKKSVVVAMNFVAWAAGNAIGPQVFLSWDAPRYFIAFATHMGCYGLLVLVMVYLRWHLKRCNRKKDDLAAAGDRTANDDHLVHAFDDLTDKVSGIDDLNWWRVEMKLNRALGE